MKTSSHIVDKSIVTRKYIVFEQTIGYCVNLFIAILTSAETTYPAQIFIAAGLNELFYSKPYIILCTSSSCLEEIVLFMFVPILEDIRMLVFVKPLKPTILSRSDRQVTEGQN